MTYQALKDLLQPTAQALTLQGSQFPDSGIEELFGSLFQSTSISITEAVAEPNDDEQTVTLKGRYNGTLWGIAQLAQVEIRLVAAFSLFGEMPVGQFTFTFVDRWSMADALNESVFGDILADLKINNHEQLLDHPIKTIGVDSGTHSFTIGINPEIALHFSDIPKYLQGTTVADDFPSSNDFPSFDTNLTFDYFEFTATLDPLMLTSISLGAKLDSTQSNWSTMADLVKFKEFQARFLLLNPLATPVVNVELGATAAVANKDIVGHIFLPSKDFQINLAANETISVKAMLETITGTEIPGMPSITCTSFGVIGAPKNKTYEIYATIKDVMEIDIGKSTIRVEEMGADFTFETGDEGGTSGNFDGKISFDNAEFSVIVEDQGGDDGWLVTGHTKSGQNLPIGTLMEELVEKIGSDTTLPGPLEALTIKDLSLSFDTKTHDFVFGCEGDFPIEGKEVAIVLNILLTKQEDGTYKKDFEGIIDVGPFTKAGILDFDLHFVQDTSETLFAATFSHKNAPLDMSLGDIIHALSANIDDIPIDLSVDLKDIILVFEKKSNESAKFLFALDIATSINLSNLPLIGKQFPSDKSVGFDHLQFLLASAEIPKADIEKWGTEHLLPDSVTPIPVKDRKKGLDIDGKLMLGPLEAPVSLPITGPDPPPAPSSPPQTATPPASPDKAKWFTVQKKIGPIDFERVGMQYTDGELWFLLDAALSVGGLTIGLQGLSVRSSLKKFDPKFSLNGLGIDFKKGTLEIGGAFLKVPDPGQNIQFEYDGTAVISMEELMIAALGSYAVLTDGHKSLFIYGVLEFPIGGPPFFFVTGLAAGFGYNRRLTAPAISQVATFPLVAEAVNGAASIPSGNGAGDALSAELAKMRAYITPEEDQYFLAVGIKFNSFKIVDSFALLTVSFGHRFELDLLGLSTLLLPTPEAGSEVEPLAEVQLALKVSFIPDDGFLGIEAQLTTASFLLSRKCHLTGGFAFYSWFKGQHRGDFVITVGGYHPSFQKPAHYPDVPRLGFNWQVTKELSLKGGAYFALTASAVMAGGRLEALWNGGALKAWFILGADFLIAWKPYHYDARVYVDMGVSYTFHFFGTHTISLDLGADLHIWGPDFTGTAKIKIWIFTVSIHFGAGASQAPQPISWPDFRTSFLPDKDQDIISISIKQGLKKQADGGDSTWIVSPKHLAFEVDAVIPIKQVALGTDALQSSGQEDFGISPMGLDRKQVDSALRLRVTDGDPRTAPAGNLNDFTHQFKLIPIQKNVPKGMWGESVQPNLNGQKFITDAVTGYQIVLDAKEEEPTTKPAPIDRHKFEFSTKDMDNYIQPTPLGDFRASYPAGWRDLLKKDMKSNNSRNAILSALGLTDEADSTLVGSYVDELILSPQFS